MSTNVFAFSGHLGRDAKVNQGNGSSVCNFTVASKFGYGQNEQTNWISCELWGKQAEGGLPALLLKGRKVTVVGELGTKEHEGRTYLRCRVISVDLASNDGQQTQQQQVQQPAPQQQSAPPPQQQQQPQQQQPPQQSQATQEFLGEDDPIPF